MMVNAPPPIRLDNMTEIVLRCKLGSSEICSRVLTNNTSRDLPFTVEHSSSSLHVQPARGLVESMRSRVIMFKFQPVGKLQVKDGGVITISTEVADLVVKYKGSTPAPKGATGVLAKNRSETSLVRKRSSVKRPSDTAVTRVAPPAASSSAVARPRRRSSLSSAGSSRSTIVRVGSAGASGAQMRRQLSTTSVGSQDRPSSLKMGGASKEVRCPHKQQTHHNDMACQIHFFHSVVLSFLSVINIVSTVVCPD